MTIRVAFTAEDQQYHLNVHLDDISIALNGGLPPDPECPITYDVYFGPDNPPTTLIACSAPMVSESLIVIGTAALTTAVPETASVDVLSEHLLQAGNKAAVVATVPTRPVRQLQAALDPRRRSRVR